MSLIYSLPFLKSFSSFKEIRAEPGLLGAQPQQGRGLGGGTHQFSTSRGKRKPYWTCTIAKTHRHLAAVWRPV